MTSTVAENTVATRPSLALISELEQVLYREARLLDREHFDEWFEMLSDDLHYYMPGLEARYRNDPTDMVDDLSRMAYYNDDVETLTLRIARLNTGTAWSEDPPTRYAHIITNIEVELTEIPNEHRVYSNFFAYRSRNQEDEDRPLVGSREDIWRKDDDGEYRLVKRCITPKWNLLRSKNLNIFL